MLPLVFLAQDNKTVTEAGLKLGKTLSKRHSKRAVDGGVSVRGGWSLGSVSSGGPVEGLPLWELLSAAGGCHREPLILNCSLMERFTDDTFCEACKSTVGVDFKIKTVELRGKKIRLQIWDTAGQERFNSITSAYYRGAKGIVLVYDITKQETFDDLPKWMKMIDKYASEDAELLLVGNKLDCEFDRVISRQQAERFASRISGMRFCEASAKDNFNVDEIFLKLVDDILSKMPLEIPSKELSNSLLSLQPEPEIPPELPPPRMRCC
ncbi:hypothetical protein DNTS_035588 [Danionella cerebrum]|uniref:Ras-related protein Rab-12 n=1 Tax=Danionella cerebrum TaxID=2873325 RepID=A0A553NKZ0_9TELE|nr:hypothetical protein DNTS_035588 [Danionella translucida]TRY66099.1 hypothetical protein DNTS_035588 [Danionella translucida]TRY66100.1 hypothetical protein DNTS_035588 [Danionella translucida]